jgi:hypothetical protein
MLFHKKENSNNDGNIENYHNNDKPLARLLIVDDDPDIVQVLKLGLQKIHSRYIC